MDEHTPQEDKDAIPIHPEVIEKLKREQEIIKRYIQYIDGYYQDTPSLMEIREKQKTCEHIFHPIWGCKICFSCCFVSFS
jgi:hypothetical protein